MADYVLVHGGEMSTDTWNEYANKEEYQKGEQMGGRVWDKIALGLKAHGHRVFAPTLKDKYKSNLSDHIEQICSLITKQNLNNIILVGHSYGGMIITGVANKMPKRIGHLVYLDSALPDPGQSLLDLLLLGGIDPATIEEGSPSPYIEKLQFDPKNLKSLKKVYIICTKSSYISLTKLAKQKISEEKELWSIVELPTSHVPQASMPDRLVEILLKMGKSS